jgi:nitrous oxidase accessory protein NosD
MEGESRKTTLSLAMVWMLLIQLAVGFMVLTTEEVSGSIRYVGPDSTYDNLQDALDDANSGDIIVISEGNFNGSFSSSKSNIYIRGNSSQNSTLILNGSQPAYLGGNGLILTRLTLANGTLVMEGDNLDLSAMRILSANGSLHLKNSSGSNLEDMELGRQVDPGIHLHNCSDIMVENIEGRGIDNSGMVIEESKEIEMKWLKHTLRDSGTGVYILNSSKILIHAFDISSVGGEITGIKASSATSIILRNGSMDAEGTGFHMDSCSGSQIHNISLTTRGDGSVGLMADGTSDLRFKMNNVLSINDSTGIRMRDCGPVHIENSSIMVSGSGKGMDGHLSDPVTIRNGSVTLEGDGSTGINLDRCDNVEVKELELQAKGADSALITMNDISSMDFFDSTVLARGARSSGLLQTGTSTDVEIEEIRFNLRGTESRGMDLEGINDSIFSGNQFRIEGAS